MPRRANPQVPPIFTSRRKFSNKNGKHSAISHSLGGWNWLQIGYFSCRIEYLNGIEGLRSTGFSLCDFDFRVFETAHRLKSVLRKRKSILQIQLVRRSRASTRGGNAH